MIEASLLLVMGVFYGVGVYLVLEKSLTKVLLGIMLLGNATNLLILQAGGPAGLAALYHPGTDPHEYLDPLPQALVLTAIVITFATTALLLGMIYRSWSLSRKDTIQQDVEDLRVAHQSDYDPEDDDAAPLEPSEFEGSEEEREEKYRETKAEEARRRASGGRGSDEQATGEPAPAGHAHDERPGTHRLEHGHLENGNLDQQEWHS